MVIAVGAALAVIYGTVFFVVYRQSAKSQRQGGNAGLYVMVGVLSFTALLGIAALIV